MELLSPKPEDHCRIQILFKPVGQIPILTFNRLVKAIEGRLCRLNVTTDVITERQIHPKLVTELNRDLTKFGEFQAFRKVFGLICVGQLNGELLSASSSPDLNSPLFSTSDTIDETPTRSPPANRLRRSSIALYPSSLYAEHGEVVNGEFITEKKKLADSKQLNVLKEQYAELKQSLNDQLVDSRCAILGNGCNDSTTTEYVFLTRTDDLSALYDQLEAVVHELLRSIYFVLESRRLDTSFERLDNPQCPILPEEEKYRIGLENIKSKAFRKKCIGRLRKKVGDYAFLTGAIESALQSYQSAIDLLKSTADLLWLAAAYEGWCCAAMMVNNKCKHRNYDLKEENFPREGHSKTIPRVYSAVNTAMTSGQEHKIKSSIGHQRYCSDEAAKLSLLPAVNGREEENSVVTTPSNHIQLQRRRSQDEAEANPLPINKLSLTATEKNSSKRQVWRQLLNFDSASSSSGSAQISKAIAKFDTTLPLPSAMSSTSRSSSAQNLASSTTIPSTPLISQLSQKTAPPNGLPPKLLISRNELSERFRAALEHYGRFSFAVYIEYECVMRAVQLLVYHRQYIEVESFLREHTCRFLDDKFVTFNNVMKSNICLAAAEVYNQIGFKRKFSFFLRLAVFFRLFLENHSEMDYKKVYPILNESLLGYGLSGKLYRSIKSKNALFNHSSNFGTTGSFATFSLQIKAVHEVCTVAVRAGLFDMAIRHLCFMLEFFFDHLDKATLLSFVEELNKLTVMQGKELHELSKPLALDSCPPVFLAPLQLTRIPILKNFHVLPLPPHLAPKVIDVNSRSSQIFIYSPFQERAKKDEICWVVNCASEVSVRVQNPLPVDLVINNFALITEGCQFEKIPIRLNLPSCYGSCIDPTLNEIKLLGVPRSIGTLKITGYECEVLGCRNTCKFPLNERFMRELNHQSDHASTYPILNQFVVRVLPTLPLLRIESSLKRSPTLNNDPNEAIAEVCVFTGQSCEHTITLCNLSDAVSIKQIVLKVHQPQTCGGPKLFEILTDNVTIDDNKSINPIASDYQIGSLKLEKRKNVNIRIYGIDPISTTFIDGHSSKASNSTTQIGQEQRVFVRSPTSLSNIATIVKDTGVITALPSFFDERKKRQSSEDTPLLEQENSMEEDTANRHDLIPYIGRLLSAEFLFTYTADISPTQSGEEYMRYAKLPIAVTIVPAVNVVSWNILSGDGPFSRYVVLEIDNQTDREAELKFSSASCTVMVRPKDSCSVPLLCPCFMNIQSKEFKKAAQQASHMMQMQEIDRLRRRLEKYLTKHLEIYWKIEKFKLEGQVPIGSLLSSVSFLRQLVLPSLTVVMEVNDKMSSKEKDVIVRLGTFVRVQVRIYCSLKDRLTGELSLECFQDPKNNVLPELNCEEYFLLSGASRVPFCCSANNFVENESISDGDGEDRNSMPSDHRFSDVEAMGTFTTEFHVSFNYEGIYKVRPFLSGMRFEDMDERDNTMGGGGKLQTLNDDDIFSPVLSIKVINTV